MYSKYSSSKVLLDPFMTGVVKPGHVGQFQFNSTFISEYEKDITDTGQRSGNAKTEIHLEKVN